jgi:TPR repeat protein
MIKRPQFSPREERAFEAFEKAYNLEESGALQEAKLAYHFAVRLGSPHAQINLGHLYDNGDFGSRDRKRAISLYKRALFHGFPEAANSLAQLYRIENNRRWYHFWLARAARMGDEDAQNDCRLLGIRFDAPRKG